jgi:hypothetical protein
LKEANPEFPAVDSNRGIKSLQLLATSPSTGRFIFVDIDEEDSNN